MTEQPQEDSPPMSDDTAALEAAPAEAEAPDTGQGEAEATPELSYLDLDQYGNHHVRVKVGGEEHEVPLAEALNGYQRQADYTRKTQEVAEQQRAAEFAITLQRALENNPQQTLRILQEQYGSQQQAPSQDEPVSDDPYDTRFRELDQRIARFDEYQAQQELQAAIGVLRGRYGDDFDPRAVVARASEQGRIDLEGVYKEIAFERYWQAQQAQQEAQGEVDRRRDAEDATRNAGKAQAGSLHQGNGAAPSSAAVPQGSASSVAEAWAQAKAQLGL